MREEPVGVNVARAKVFGRTELRAVAPSEVRIPPGKRFELRLMYDLQEASPEKEQYVFELTSRLDRGDEQVKKVQYGDKWGLPQSVIGYVAQPYTLDEPGVYDISFKARVEYAKRKWLSRDDPKLDERVVDGHLKITVE